MSRHKPSRYLDYNPPLGRTLESKRSWRERVLDIRHAACITRYEFIALCGANPKPAEIQTRSVYRPNVPMILAIRRMEAIFREELIRYLMKPHGWLRYREHRLRRLDTYGGYRTRLSTPGYLDAFAIVSFQGRSFEDIGAMVDLDAIRALKVVKLGNALTEMRHDFWERLVPERDSYTRILEAASRGHFMPVAEIARVVAGDSTEQT